jgi:hypothetical protein
MMDTGLRVNQEEKTCRRHCKEQKKETRSVEITSIKSRKLLFLFRSLS